MQIERVGFTKMQFLKHPHTHSIQEFKVKYIICKMYVLCTIEINIVVNLLPKLIAQKLEVRTKFLTFKVKIKLKYS